MFEKAAFIITQNLYDKQIISKEDMDLYKYGFNMGLTVVLNLISTILIGVIMGMVFESIAFLAFYIPLRSYAGGYHAKTPWRCYFVSLFIIAAVLAFCRFVPLNFVIYGSLLAAGSIVCIFLAPVQTDNKPLDDLERQRYRKISIVILLIEICIWAFLVFVLRQFEKIIPIVVFIEAVMLFCGKDKNKS